MLFIVPQALQRPMQNVSNVEPLSLVTEANHCAVFVRKEMICANKERSLSSTHCCAFSSQNCK